jgi:hypothetical protein
MAKSKSKRKRKAAVAKHIVVTAPLKIHLPHEFIAEPIDWDARAVAEAAAKKAFDLAEASTVARLMPDPISVTDKIAPPWWKFWA